MYENLNLGENLCSSIEDADRFKMELIDSFICEKLLHGLVYVLKIFINPSKISQLIHTSFGYPYIVEETFWTLFESNTIDLANEILAAYEENYAGHGGIMAGLIRIAWFMLACEHKKDHANLIQALFDSIDMAATFKRADRTEKAHGIKRIRVNYCFLYYELAYEMLHNFEVLKESLIQKPSDAEKYVCIKDFLTSNQMWDISTANIRWDSKKNRVCATKHSKDKDSGPSHSDMQPK